MKTRCVQREEAGKKSTCGLFLARPRRELAQLFNHRGQHFEHVIHVLLGVVLAENSSAPVPNGLLFFLELMGDRSFILAHELYKRC